MKRSYLVRMGWVAVQMVIAARRGLAGPGSSGASYPSLLSYQLSSGKDR